MRELAREEDGLLAALNAQRAHEEARQAKRAAQQSKEIDRLQTVVDRFGAKATKAAMAHNVEKRIARLERDRVHAPTSSRTMSVRFPDPPSCGATVLRGESLAKSDQMITGFSTKGVPICWSLALCEKGPNVC